ncbi:MAG: carboxypeptidase-like regulatory domain-containing protein [Bacteroidia bacterium]
MVIRILSIILLSYSSTAIWAQQLRGTVSNTNGKPIASASVSVENSTNGVITNLKGEYYFNLKPGTYRIKFQNLGYQEKVIEVTISDKTVIRHIVLQESVFQLAPITIMADGEDPAYSIIRSAIANKKKYFEQFETYSARVYNKASLEREEEIQNIDSVGFKLTTSVSNTRMEFVESISSIYLKAPNQYKEIKHAYQDHSKNREIDFGNSAQISATFTPTMEDYGPPPFVANQLLFYDEVTDADFNFYQNLMDLPAVYDKPFVSPISNTAMLAYRFKLLSSFMEDGVLVHKIQVEPRRDAGPYFTGLIYIVDELWCIKAVDFTIDKNSLNAHRYFKMFANYTQIEKKYWVAEREEFFYNLSSGKEKIIGHTVAMYSNYEIEPELEKGFFDNALSIVSDTAENKGADYWSSVRPITLKPEELGYIKKQDSIRTYYSSETYLSDADSSYNATGILDFLIMGVGYRNSFKGYQFFLNPLIAQPRPFAVGGYRHSVGGSYRKTFKESRKSIGVNGEVNYGFLNRDLRGTGTVSYLFNPIKFAEIEIGGGSIYEMINNYESIAATFSRGNYALKEHALIGYKQEITNGVFAHARLEWSDQQSLEDYNLANWSNTLFGGLNEPQPFERYTNLELEVNLTIRFKQEYYLRPNQKIIQGSKYPQLRVHYRWGIPNTLGSMVNYHFLELRVFDDFKIGSIGISKYNVRAGSFINSRPLRFTDNKFFRGSDRFFYSNPLHSFQLMPVGISTAEPYLEAHYIHHFNGAVFDKVPYLNRLNLRTVVGGGSLLEYSNNFAHIESFVGIEKPFRIKEQLMKFGVYYVTASTNLPGSEFDAQIKFGLDFYNGFTNSWNY